MVPIISTIPALFIGLETSPWMAVKVIAVVITVHLFDLNLISPRVVGQRLNIHPITIVFLLIVSLSLFGVVGMFVITPLYADLRVLFFELYGKRRKRRLLKILCLPSPTFLVTKWRLMQDFGLQ